MIYAAANEDFTKIDTVIKSNVSSFLYFINFYKRKQQLESARIERSRNNH